MKLNKEYLSKTNFMPLLSFHTSWKQKKQKISDIFRGYRRDQ